MLESPDGKYPVYAETTAVTHKRKNAQDDEEVECEEQDRALCGGPAEPEVSAGNECVAQV